MSFVISFNGQFKPYILPDLTHFDKVNHVYKSEAGQIIGDENEFTNLLSKKELKRQRDKKNVLKKYHVQEEQFEKQNIPHHAKDIMSSNLKLLSVEQNFQEAKDLMLKYNIHHLPIINKDNTLTGIISDRDLLSAKSSMSVKEIMSPEVLTCLEGTRIQEISKIMLHKKISAIPIINQNYELVGIVTKNDILRFLTGILSINQLI